ncbi:phage tail tip protein J-related protein [Shewanella sp. 1180_01]|uniref:phage tail tip protein J-related protein n=1 Tax=Shewanella sp. 1180_01 TaxID=2604451 RepID=UPI004063F6BF
MPPVIVGIAAGIAAAGVVSTAAAIAIGIGAAALTYAATPKFDGGSFANEAFTQQQMLRSPVEPRRGIYGRAMVSGPLVFAEETGADNAYLHLVIPLAGHRCDGVEKIYFGDDVAWANGALTSKYASVARLKVHLGNQTTSDPDLTAECRQWTSSHVGFGVTYLYARLKFDTKVFPNGVPNIKALVRGKQVYDPRKNTHNWEEPTTWEWSDNWALCCLDYNRFESGVGAAAHEIDVSYFAAAANDSDQLVEYKTGKFEKRYTCNGTYNQDVSPSSIMEKMLTAGAGMHVYVSGQYRLYAGVYQGPEVLVLTEDDAAGDIDVRPYTPRAELCNAVRGTFVDPENFYQPTDFPPYESSYYRAHDDGEYIDHDLDLPFTQSVWTAQRLGKLYLEQKRAGMQISMPVKMIGVAVSVGKVVGLSLPRLGIDGTFQIVDWQFDYGKPVSLILIETSAELFDYAMGSYTERDLTPNVILPNPATVPTPIGLQYVEYQDDPQWQGQLTWSAPANNSSYRYVIEVSNGLGEVVYQTNADATRSMLPKLDTGFYTVSLWALNLFANRSNVPATLTIGATLPAPVIGIAVIAGPLTLTLRPTTAAQIAQTTQFEILGSITNNIAEAALIGTGKDAVWPDRHPNTRYHVWARTINNYGVSSWYGPVEATTSADNTSIIDLIGNTFKNYTWFAWADDASGTGFTTIEAIGDGKAYMGIAPDKPTASSSGNWQDYTWSKINAVIPPVFTPEEEAKLDNLMAGKLPFAPDKDMLAAQDALSNPALANNLITALSLLNQGISAPALGGETPTGAQSKATAAQNAAAADATTKANNAKAAAETYALAKANLAEVTAKAYADGIVSDEEERAIADATAKANAAQSAAITAAAADATSKANNAKAQAEANAALDALNKANTAKAGAISAAATDATTKANNAKAAAETYALAKANLAEVTAKAYADGIVSDEEDRAIADAQAKADAAKTAAIAAAAADATSKANNAKAQAEANAALDALNKANTAKTDAISTASTDATTKANNAKTQAISSAATDATTKANSAQSAAIAAAAADATTKANNAKAQAEASAALDALNKANAARDEALTGAQTKVDGLSIGGVNLINNTKSGAFNTGPGTVTAEIYLGFSVIEHIYSTGSFSDFCTTTVSADGGLEYTLSFYAKADRTTAIRSYFYNPNTTLTAVNSQGHNSVNVDGMSNFTVGTEWQRCWVSWSQSAPASIKTLIVCRIMTLGAKVSICGVKFEQGNKATAWSQSEGDVQSKADAAKAAAIAAAAADATSKANNAKAQAEANAALDALNKANTAKADAISTAASDATTKANNAKAAAESYALAKANLAETTAKAYADGIVDDEEARAIADATTKANAAQSAAIAAAAADATSKANNAKAQAEANAALDALNKANTARDEALTGAKTKVDGLSIGGINLINNTKSGAFNPIPGTISGETYLGFSVMEGVLNSGSYLDLVKSIVAADSGLEYTLSFYAKADRITQIRSHFYSPNTTLTALNSQGHNSTSSDGGSYFSIGTEWQRCWVSWSQSAPANIKNLIVCRIMTLGAKVSICGVKFEQGNKATAWSPSDGDIQATADAAKLQAIGDVAAGNFAAQTALITTLLANSGLFNQLKSRLGIFGGLTAETIAALAIATNHLQAGAVTVDKVSANAITAEKIAALAIATNHLQAGAITADKVGANAITAAKIAALAIATNHLQAGAITADKVGANAITAEKIAALAIATNHLQAGAITADKVGANAITAEKIAALAIATNHLQAGAVTADKITADTALIQKLIANSGLFNQLQAQLGAFGGLAANSIAAGAIQTDKLAILAREYVNPVSTSGNLIGWGGVSEDGTGGNSAIISYDSTEKALVITSNALHSVWCKSWKINHDKIYRVSMKIKASSAAGSYYLGAQAWNMGNDGGNSAGGNAQGNMLLYPYSTGRVAQGSSANIYFSYGSPTTEYVDHTVYLIGANRDVNDCPAHTGPSSNPFIKLEAAATDAGIRLLNWSNTSTKKLFVKDISVTEVGAGQVVAQNIAANAVTADKIAANAVSAGKIAANAVTATEVLADTALINKLVATSALFDSLVARLAVFGGLTANSIASDAILGRHIKAGEIIESPIISGGQYRLIGANTMKIESETPFGPDSLVEWRGPKLLVNGVPDWNNIRKSNATRWTDASGDEYFGGSLSSGVLKTGVTNPSLVPYAPNSYPVEIGPFGSNGKAKVVVLSFRLSADSQQSSNGSNATQPQLSWQLQRKIGGGSWATVSSGVFNGTTNFYYEAEPPVHWLSIESCNGSSTFTDNTVSTSDFSYRVLVLSYSRFHVTSNVNTQYISLISTEQ